MRKSLLVIALALPGVFLLNLIQAYQFESFRRDVKAQVAEQEEWVQKNKRLAGGITVLSSPQRVDDLAKEVLKLPEGKNEVKVIFSAGRKIDG